MTALIVVWCVVLHTRSHFDWWSPLSVYHSVRRLVGRSVGRLWLLRWCRSFSYTRDLSFFRYESRSLTHWLSLLALTDLWPVVLCVLLCRRAVRLLCSFSKWLVFHTRTGFHMRLFEKRKGWRETKRMDWITFDIDRGASGI